MGAACLFVLFVVSWVGSTCSLLFLALSCTVGVRVSEETEEAGLDASKHGGLVLGAVTAADLNV